MDRTVRQESREYVSVTLTSPDDLTGIPVELSFDSGATWHAAEVIGDNARVLVGPSRIELPRARILVLVRVTDSPEIPVFPASGDLVIV